MSYRKNYEGNIQFTGDIVSENNTTESLSASYISCDNICSKTCSVLTLAVHN